jgi:hypothetical protein
MAYFVEWSAMPENYAAMPSDYESLAPVRCDRCGSPDTIPLPVSTLMDRLRWAGYFGPFKCRKCHAKLYRRVKKIGYTGE